MTVDTLPDSWTVSEGSVRLSDVVKTAPVSRASIDVATRNGLISVTRKAGRGDARWISVDEAVLVLSVALLAVAAGIAFGALLRAIRNSGAQITSTGLHIPLIIPN